MVMNYTDPTAFYELAGSELTEGLGDEQVERLITHASRIMRVHTRSAIYPTDGAGNPTNEKHIDAFNEATCEQVRAWVEAGLMSDVLTGGTTREGVITSSSINGASVSVDMSAAESAKARLVAGGLAPAAEMILRDAGLLGGFPWIRI